MIKSHVFSDLNSKTILEVGCGKGVFSSRMAKTCKFVVGLDICPSSIRTAKELAKKLGSSEHVDFIIGDAQFLPLRDREFFITFCSETLEHIPHFDKAFEQLVRVTQKSGYLCATIPNYISTQLLELCLWSIIGESGHRHGWHIFHYPKVMKLFKRDNLEILDVRGTDFLHIPFLSFKRMMWGIKKHSNESRLFKFMRYLEKFDHELKFLGSNIGVLARVKK